MKTSELKPEPPKYVVILCWISYGMIFLVSYVRELIFGITSKTKEIDREGYVPLYTNFDSFFIRNVFRRSKDVFFQPIASAPGAKVDIVDRVSHDYWWSSKMLETKKTCINLGSYNYLGFAESSGACTNAAIKSIEKDGLSCSSMISEVGFTETNKLLNNTTAQFLGADAAITFGMGFATNSLNLPSIITSDCLVLSDQYNHASICLGIRLSGGTVKVFKHNDMNDLESKIQKAIIQGHPRTRRPWSKIIIIVEGVYSMEGTIVNLPEVIKIKKKYGAYIYLDEAHSVGAMGPNGRGVVDYYGLNPKDIDMLMGTFTKSFGAAGGYIAGSQDLINHLTITSHASSYAISMSSPVAMQIVTAMNIIMYTKEGKHRIQQLSSNAKYFRKSLIDLGLIVYGHNDSPVVPLLLYNPCKVGGFVNELLRHNIATVGVGYPANPIGEERARFCLSSSHTREMIDEALAAIAIAGNRINVIFTRKMKSCDNNNDDTGYDIPIKAIKNSLQI